MGAVENTEGSVHLRLNQPKHSTGTEPVAPDLAPCAKTYVCVQANEWKRAALSPY